MSGLLATYEWGQLPWRKLEVAVFKLQKRIYRASQAGDVWRRFTVTVTTRYTVGTMNSPNDEVLMTRAPLTEEPCAAKVASTVLKASGGGDPFAEPNRALKLMIRQRHNSRFFASAYRAQGGSVLCSVIATALKAGINGLDYLVALQRHRREVMAHPSRWLPWNYAAPS